MTGKTLKDKSVSPKVSTGTNKGRRKKKKQDVHDSTVSDGICVRELTYLPGPRKKTSITVNAEFWAWFVDYCQKTGGSTCRWIDNWMLGLRGHVEEGKSFEVVPGSRVVVVVNVHPVRNIKRVRRRKAEVVEDAGGVDEGFNDVVGKAVTGSRLKCTVCPRPSFVRGINKDDSQVWLCRNHFEERRHGLVRWRYVKEVR